MSTILIVVVLMLDYRGGTAVSTVQFDTREACIAAATYVVKQVDHQHVRVYASCHARYVKP